MDNVMQLEGIISLGETLNVERIVLKYKNKSSA